MDTLTLISSNFAANNPDFMIPEIPGTTNCKKITTKNTLDYNSIGRSFFH